MTEWLEKLRFGFVSQHDPFVKDRKFQDEAPFRTA